MHKFYRSVLLTGMVAVGLAGCGDDLTIVEPPPPPPPPTPTVKSISVAPNPGSVPVGGTITMSAAVVADAGVATTVTWSSSDASKATVNATSGVVTGVAAGSVAITATSTVNPAVQGNATVNVTATASTVTGVTVTPGTAGLVVGQTVQLSASVQGTNNPAQTVTWSSLSSGIASVSAGGLVTAVANGTAVIRGCSTVAGFTNVCGSMSVTVVTPTPAAVSIQSLTMGTLGTPVVLTAVTGQIEATINVESGQQQLDRVDVLVGGQVLASQSFAVTPAPAEEGAAGAPVTVVLSFNVNQLRKVNNLFVPVIFNGPTAVTANLYVTGSSTPLASNAIPIVTVNPDLMLRPTSLTAAATAGPILNGGNNWYKGNVALAGGNYISFFPVTPSITWASTGTVTCGSTGNLVTGTPSTGIALAGTFTCGSTVENAINLGAYTVTPGTAPAPDVTYVAAAGFTQVGTAFTVAGENRYNPLTAAAPALANVFIDNKAPVVAIGNVAFNDSFDQPWINASYNFLTAGDLTAPDAGSGVAAGAIEARIYNVGTFTPASAGCSATVVTTGNDFAETTTSSSVDGKRICTWATDRLGNAASSGPSNYFGVDKVAPSIRFMGTTAATPAPVGPVSTVSATANTTIYSIAANWPAAPAYFGVEANDTRSGFHQGAAITNFPVNVSQSYFNSAGTTTCANTYGLPLVLSDAWVRSSEMEFNCNVGAVAYYQWAAFVTDRAGNASTTVARNHANDNVAAADITNMGYGQLTFAPGMPASFNVWGTDDLEIIEGTLLVAYDNNTPVNGAEWRVRYPYSMFPLGTRWDATITNTVAGVPLTIANLIGRIDSTQTATNLPAATFPSRQTALPDSVYANLRDVASQADATPLVLGLSAVTMFTDSTAAPWGNVAITPTAVFGDPNSQWSISSATAGFEIATQRTGTSVTVPYFDSVNLYGVIGGELVLCGTYGAPVLTDNGVFRTWTYSMATPTGTNACVGATGWRAGGVKGNAVLLTQQVAP